MHIFLPFYNIANDGIEVLLILSDLAEHVNRLPAHLFFLIHPHLYEGLNEGAETPQDIFFIFL